MDESTSKPDPELQRVAEILRPLWPGIVLRYDQEYRGVRLYSGDCGVVRVAVAIADGVGGSFAVTFSGAPLGSGLWTSPDGQELAIRAATADARARLADLLMALGLEVADG